MINKLNFILSHTLFKIIGHITEDFRVRYKSKKRLRIPNF